MSHPKRPRDPKGPLWRLRHNTAYRADGLRDIPAGRSTSPRPSASWLNAVEGFFARLTRRRLKRGVFRSLVDLQAAINRFLAETNSTQSPSSGPQNPKRVLAAVKRGKEALESIH